MAKQDFHASPTIQMPRFAGGSFPRIAIQVSFTRLGLQFWGSWANMFHVYQLQPSQGEIGAGVQGIGMLPMLDALGIQLSRKGLKRPSIILFKACQDRRDIWDRLRFLGSWVKLNTWGHGGRYVQPSLNSINIHVQQMFVVNLSTHA